MLLGKYFGILVYENYCSGKFNIWEISTNFDGILEFIKFNLFQYFRTLPFNYILSAFQKVQSLSTNTHN
jgi:hypothetical protein